MYLAANRSSPTLPGLLPAPLCSSAAINHGQQTEEKDPAMREAILVILAVGTLPFAFGKTTRRDPTQRAAPKAAAPPTPRHLSLVKWPVIPFAGINLPQNSSIASSSAFATGCGTLALPPRATVRERCAFTAGKASSPTLERTLLPQRAKETPSGVCALLL